MCLFSSCVVVVVVAFVDVYWLQLIVLACFYFSFFFPGSTLASGLNSLSAVFLEDVYRPIHRIVVTEIRATQVAMVAGIY